MQRRYRDLEHLLFRGFIPYKISVHGVNIVLKTVNEHEYERVKLMSGFEKDPRYLFLFNLNYLFYSMYMIDGVNILKNREDSYPEFAYILKQLPSVFFKSLSDILEDLVKKQNNCSLLVEQYSLENDSRYNWESKKNYLLNNPSQTTIEGSELLGMNQFQKYWSVLNIREDKKEAYEQQYSLFKFLASFTDSKSVKKIEAADKVRKEEEEKRRERLRVIGTEEELKYLSGPTDTREGIVKELEKQMKGEKDEHDIFIEEYEKKIRKDMLKRMSDMTKLKEMRRQQLDEMGDEVRTISKEEMEERIKKIKERKEKNMQSYETNPEQSSKFYQMSTVKDKDLLTEEDFISEEDYRKLTGDDTYKKLTGQSDEDRERAERNYRNQQKTLASKFNYEDDEVDLDFPHLKR